MSESPIAKFVAGTIGGVGATIVMSGVFFAAQRLRAIGDLPPTIIVRDVSPQLEPTSQAAVATVAHLGYGAAAGAVFTLLVPRQWRSASAGVVFGIAVWAASYEGWLPFLRILPLAHRDARPRAISILLAHLVYGGALGALTAHGARRN